MRKSVVLFMLLLVSFVLNAQNRVNFKLNTDCQYEVSGTNKNYYVFQYEGESQASLFNKTLIGVTKTFVSAKDVVSKVENSLISINSTHRIEYYLAGIVKVVNNVTYVVEFEFKEGRLKVNAPTIVSISNQKGETPPISDFLLTTSGELSSSADKYLFVNDIINNILANIKQNSSDDW